MTQVSVKNRCEHGAPSSELCSSRGPHYNAYGMAETQKPTCFIIAPIGGKDTEIRKRSDKVLRHIFRKALAEKYAVTRGDEIDEPGMITSQVLRAVQEYDLVVADLTGHNPNVLYELAVRHAVEKPVIHVIEPKLSKIPFDIAGFRTIEFDLTDPDSIEGAVEQVKKQAHRAISGTWGETPIKLANIMRRAKGDTPEMSLLKQAVQGIADISAMLAPPSASVLDAFSGAAKAARILGMQPGPSFRAVPPGKRFPSPPRRAQRPSAKNETE